MEPHGFVATLVQLTNLARTTYSAYLGYLGYLGRGGAIDIARGQTRWRQEHCSL